MRYIPLIVATSLAACGPSATELEDARRAGEAVRHERQVEQRIGLIADSAYSAEEDCLREEEFLAMSKYDLQMAVDSMELVLQIQLGRSPQEREEEKRAAAKKVEQARLQVQHSEDRIVTAKQRAAEWRKKLEEAMDAE